MKRDCCGVAGCGSTVKARGYCNMHYLRDVRHGSPTGGGAPRIMDDGVRLWSQIDAAADCWVWTASKTGGYGVTLWEGTRWRVHRLVWTLLVGPIGDGLQLDHICRNRACCNPDHLEPVTQQVNIARGERPARKYCANGHPYDVVIERRNGRERRCSICANARRRVRREP